MTDDALTAEMTAWRRHLHAHPETAFEEVETARFVADRLREFGLDPHLGLAKTGVVATLKRGSSNRAIGLRADIDALDIPEANTFGHASKTPGKMHACGHDGHTAMLLGAAKRLTTEGGFDGTVHFIFQPAEENEGGGRAMVEDGLFDAFPMDAVYGMHNWPALPLGTVAVAPGPMMASFDVFEIVLSGRGTHAAMPHLGDDVLLAAGQLITALQSISSRTVDPLDAVVVSVTQMHGGDTWNVLPAAATLRGTVRAFSSAVQDTVEATMRRIAEGIAAAHGATATLRYERRYPATINDPKEAAFCAGVLEGLFGADNLDTAPRPVMGAEDFAFLLAKKPGAYVWLGAGRPEGSPPLHNPAYDFNDAALPRGADYWVRLTRAALPER
ncbi:Hippurate hydrolase [uncultured Alphaproteobacteria bacterium]|uniref:Hippurate hydrolase n=1 Tax=uncultured Alphaproteobacteria bacterium TaxID=91750 RepID=A0A212KI35_9PROT|nr:Hippurate hydrolase [uncultured Alphaproteobacteria bacterium]